MAGGGGGALLKKITRLRGSPLDYVWVGPGGVWWVGFGEELGDKMDVIALSFPNGGWCLPDTLRSRGGTLIDYVRCAGGGGWGRIW